MTAPEQVLRFATADVPMLTLAVHGAPDPAASASLPVLLLHGLSQQRHFWEPVATRMRNRPVAALDQRGHGDTDTPLTVDYSVVACAGDAIAALDALGWNRAIVVGHSWGASVALSAAASRPERVAAAVLLDGGLWSPSALGERSEVRERLRPPALGIPEQQLWERVSTGDLGPTWTAETRAALAPTFVSDASGNLRTRLGVERHMRVLDGLLDYDADADLDRCESVGMPVWAAVCERGGPAPDGSELDRRWQDLKLAALAATQARANCRLLRLGGAVHDVPLQWPALVAGLIDAVVESDRGGKA